MTNPLNRGSAPGRERSADQRPGTFKRGHKKLGGRKRGTPNAFSADYRKALVEAAYRVGSDGNGTDGIVGYFEWVARYHAPCFVLMLASVLPWEFLGSDTAAEPSRTTDEINEEIREWTGLADKPAPKRPRSWTGQDFPVGELMQCAVEDPEGFCKLLVAAFWRPPTGRDIRRAWEAKNL